MSQFFFGLLAGVVVGLVMEWVIDWTGLLPNPSPPSAKAKPSSRTSSLRQPSAPRRAAVDEAHEPESSPEADGE